MTLYQRISRVRSWVLRPMTGIIVFGLVLLALLFLSITAFPRWIVEDSIHRKGQPIGAIGSIKAENDVRAALVQAIGGLVVALGAWTAWRQLNATRERNREELRLAREGQITDRFTRAIDQLGGHDLSIRLGGIYALERIARESERDYWPIIEVLTAYIRENTSWERDQPMDQLPRPEVHAILSVLRQRTWSHEDQRLDLHGTNLGTGNLQGANLRRANLQGANLRQANLSEAELHGAEFQGANLECADLRWAVLAEAQLYRADLTGANLQGADLSKTELRETIFRLADLRQANFEWAATFETDLGGADLRGANLLVTDPWVWELSSAHWDDTTKWPHDLDPKPISTKQDDNSWILS